MANFTAISNTASRNHLWVAHLATWGIPRREGREMDMKLSTREGQTSFKTGRTPAKARNILGNFFVYIITNLVPKQCNLQITKAALSDVTQWKIKETSLSWVSSGSSLP
jgi:hypothetical protein